MLPSLGLLLVVVGGGSGAMTVYFGFPDKNLAEMAEQLDIERRRSDFQKNDDGSMSLNI